MPLILFMHAKRVSREASDRDRVIHKRTQFCLAANHRYGLIFAVGPRRRYRLRAAARCKDNGWRRRDGGANNRRTSMYPIPGNIVGACETDVVRPIHIYVESAKRSPATGPGECLACGNRKHSVERQDQRRTDFTLHGTRTNSQVKELNPEVS